MMKWNGWKMACALVVLCIAIAIASPAETAFKTVLNFDGTNGSAPTTALVQGLDGDLYGVTSFGGKNNAGTFFKITTEGKLTTLYSFCSKTNCADGEYPEASLLLATNGNFYGTTKEGGFKDCPVTTGGCGTVFEITPEGKLTTPYTFCVKGGENCTDGANPQAPLIQGTNGDFYGTTFYGGNSHDAGTLFEMTPEGKLTTLHTFCSEDGDYCHDGANPEGPMALVPADAADNEGAQAEGTTAQASPQLMGTTSGGGATHYEGSPCGYGMVWKKELDINNGVVGYYWWCEEELDRGGEPLGVIVALGFRPPQSVSDADAKSSGPTFFGATGSGGANLSGVVYKLTTSRTYTLLHSFCSEANCADGAYPGATVTEGTDGNLYGTTEGGDGNSKCPSLKGCGTVYEITPEGVLTTLHSFESTDGEYPHGLVQATNGTFYGTTMDGGANGDGTVFSISVGLGPFIATVPTIGAVGSSVMILGTDLTGATSVTFNGTAADFEVVSATEIKATVPSGATTGTVEVVTPKGTLKSFPFNVS
jgi:uncharacterized repeat protein (TIGR03803 family)